MSQFECVLVIEMAKMTAILIFENKEQVDYSNHRNKKRGEKIYGLSFKNELSRVPVPVQTKIL